MSMSMINFDSGFDPYKNYTAVIKKSAHIANTEPVKSEKTNNSIEDETYKNVSKTAVSSLKSQLPQIDISDISESLKGIADFSFVGRDSDISKLDNMATVSDSKKDDILSDYQFFVAANY